MTSGRKQSAGLLPYRFAANGLEVLLVHPGGPLWAGKDHGAWTIAKGEFDGEERAFDAARREFAEETGQTPPGPFIELPPFQQRSGKTIYAWAVAFDFDPATLRSNLFSMEWPPRSGRQESFPEVDRAEWFSLLVARAKILPSQGGLLDELERALR